MISNAKDYLGKDVEVIIDRTLGSMHPIHNFVYKLNYGYVPDTKSRDGEELDAYVLGVDKPLSKFQGKCIAILQRTNDDDDKLIVVPQGVTFSDAQIDYLVSFQEKWFKHKIIRE